MSTLKLYLPISGSNFEKICLSKSLLCTNEELDGKIYKKKERKKRSLSKPKKCSFNLNHVISVIDLSTNFIPVDICLLIKTASPPLFLLGSLLLQFM
jgi:hypothetical protein